MSKQHTYSDEYISAYIDGELATDERTQLLFDELENSVLAQRINAARILKEKIQIAYSNICSETTPNAVSNYDRSHNRYRSVLASLFVLIALSTLLIFNANTDKDDSATLAKQLVASTQPISSDAISDSIGAHDQVIIHISQYEKNRFGTTLNHIESVLQKNDMNKSFNLEIVTNGQGLKALDVTTSLYAERITQLAKKFDKLSVVACAKSMKKFTLAGNPIQLLQSIMIVPSATEQIAKRVDKGWLYLKI